ncbi:hypothetical protein K440DRAFT_642143 [Wilcoxina mikolae CBS 423.85]|nr:hypothetical protein K440DRAFT_642143 [Wilcoxina mikolae CBS 423.85]
MFEGKLDLHLVFDFIQRIELLAVNMGMAPKETTGHSNKPIQRAVAWLTASVVLWFCNVIRSTKYEEVNDRCVSEGSPFNWNGFTVMLHQCYSTANAEDSVWLDHERMPRTLFPSFHQFHQAFTEKSRLMGLQRESEKRCSRHYAIHKNHMKKEEESCLFTMMISRHSSALQVTLDDGMRIVEECEMESAVKKFPTNFSGSSNLTSVQSDVTTPSATLTATCLNRKGYGHFAYQCPSDTGYTPCSGSWGKNYSRERWGWECGHSGGSKRGVNNNNIEVNTTKGVGEGEIIGEVGRDGKIPVLSREKTKEDVAKMLGIVGYTVMETGAGGKSDRLLFWKIDAMMVSHSKNIGMGI